VDAETLRQILSEYAAHVPKTQIRVITDFEGLVRALTTPVSTVSQDELTHALLKVRHRDSMHDAAGELLARFRILRK